MLVLFLIMLYVASGKKFFLVVGFGLAAPAAWCCTRRSAMCRIRVNTWLDPFSDAVRHGLSALPEHLFAG